LGVKSESESLTKFETLNDTIHTMWGCWYESVCCSCESRSFL